MKENMNSFIALNGSCFFSGPVCPQTRSSLTATTQTGFFWCEQVRYHRVRLFSFSPTNISHLILIFLLQLNRDLRLFVLPHESAEQLSDSKQLRKYDQGAFWPFHICRLWSCDADDFHWADWLLPTGTSGCFHDGNMEHRNLIFVVRVIMGRRCLAVCLWEETSPRAPTPPPYPGPGQPASSSHGVTTISSRCAPAPLQPQKWFWRYVSHQWSKESSSESSQNFLPLHRSVGTADRNKSGDDWKPKFNIHRSNPDSYRWGLRPHVNKKSVVKPVFVFWLF